jgi:hypothetical protein
MRTITLQVATVLLLLTLGFYFANKPKKISASPTPISIAIPKTDSTEKKSSNASKKAIAYQKLETWLLNAPNLPKPKKCYKAIIENIYNYILSDSCHQSEDILRISEDEFSKFAENIKILPVNDQYIMAKVKEFGRDMDCVYALFNNQDSLIAFYYDCPFFGNDEYDSLRIETWNPDGNLKLLVDRHHTRSHFGNESYSVSTEVFDFTSITNKFIKIFDNALASSRYDVDNNIETSYKRELVFERPDLLKIVDKRHDEAGLHGDNTPLYAHSHPLRKDSSIITYYKQDVLSKQYIEIKK